MSNVRRQQVDLQADEMSIAAKASIAEDRRAAEAPRSSLGGLTLYFIDSFAMGAVSFYGGPAIELPDDPESAPTSVASREPKPSPLPRLTWRVVSSVGAGIRRICRYVAQKHAASRDIAELAAMDDRLLRDIGLTRSQIPGVARYGRDHGSWD
jgi:uncharacterized protein YjiS (DUF1127 family)